MNLQREELAVCVHTYRGYYTAPTPDALGELHGNGWMEIPQHAHTPFMPCLAFMSCPVPWSYILCQNTGAENLGLSGLPQVVGTIPDAGTQNPAAEAAPPSLLHQQRGWQQKLISPSFELF